MPCITHDCTASQHQDTERSYLILHETAFPRAQMWQRASNDVRTRPTDGLQWTCCYCWRSVWISCF